MTVYRTVDVDGVEVFYREAGDPADRSVDEAIESAEGPADDPELSMYTSARTVYVQFPRLEPGDVVELQYRVDDVGERGEFAGYFGELEYLQSEEPIGHAEYVVISPKERPLYVDTERVPGYFVAAAGLRNLAPDSFTRPIEEGTEPSPAAVAAMDALIAQHRIRVLLYNSQSVSPITSRLRDAARRVGVPVVPVTETLPSGLTFQQWQLNQARALAAALAR